MTALTRPFWIEARFERREGWDDDVYPFNLPVVRTTKSLAFHPRVTFLVGENGSGKSTLIEALAVAWGFNAEGGSKDHQFTTQASHSPLHRFVRPIRAPIKATDGYFLRAESFFNSATYLNASGTGRTGQAGLHEQGCIPSRHVSLLLAYCVHGQDQDPERPDPPPVSGAVSD